MRMLSLSYGIPYIYLTCFPNNRFPANPLDKGCPSKQWLHIQILFPFQSFFLPKRCFWLDVIPDFYYKLTRSYEQGVNNILTDVNKVKLLFVKNKKKIT